MIYDIAINGGGSAGLSVAAAAAQLGQSVVLFEKGEMGATAYRKGQTHHADLSYERPNVAPVNLDLLKPACDLLEQNGWLAENAWIYTESERRPSELGLPANWRLHREQKAGGVNYALWEREAAPTAAAE